MGIINTGIQAGLGMATAKWQNKQQIEQAKKLQGIQMEGQKEMGEFNKGLAIDTWNETNFEAQRKHMENAGLNVGLMYSGAGGGGGTTTQAGNVTGQSAEGGNIGMGMQAIQQAQLTAAQVENIKADTENKKAETTKTAGVDTQEGQAKIKKLVQDTKNAEVENAILEYEKTITGIQATVDKANLEHKVTQMATQTDTMLEQLEQQKIKTKGDQTTYDQLEASLKADLVKRIAEGIATSERMKFDTGTEADVLRWMKGAADMLDSLYPKIKIETQKGAQPVKGFGK